ncbi:MAG: hypothetical protein LBV20_06980 [Treponema sp.]|jgi:hypothetical protein|nr:hypothetical protein [Treponema sp.]
MENTFRISLRLTSDLYDFDTLISELTDYKISYNKKDNSVLSSNINSSFKAKSNVLLVKDLYVNNNITDEDNDVIIDKLMPLINFFSLIKNNDVKHEVYISSRIENQQFGFQFNHNLLSLLSEYNYKISFSGISYV